MDKLLTALLVLAAVIVLWLLVRRINSSPSVAMFHAIEFAMGELQRVAVDNVLPEQPEGGVAGFNPEKMEKQTARIGNSLRLVYTVKHHEEGFLHTASSQLVRPAGHKYHTQCTFIIMLVLYEELKECGIPQEDVSISMHESELGTQFVYMELTAEQHERFVGGLRTAAQNITQKAAKEEDRV